MKTMKNPYVAPEAARLRVFLEKSVAANTSAQLVGPDAGVTQTGWSDTYTATPANEDIGIEF
jgi:hypothetical protein